MCGRFTLTLDPAKLRDAFPGIFIPDELKPRFNIAPSQPVAVIPNTGENKLDFFTWGLIPSWAKDPDIGNRLINARAETITEKPSFRTSFKRRRCLILADGFFEWKVEDNSKRKTPYFIRLKSGQPFAFAGLWDAWRPADGSEILSCAIITTTPNELTGTIHNRMPAILAPNAYEEWLDVEEQKPEALSAFLKPYPASEMTAYPISNLVNAPQNDIPEVIKPAADHD
jgi:putative SOS response-associated peptidase YedK